MLRWFDMEVYIRSYIILLVLRSKFGDLILFVYIYSKIIILQAILWSTYTRRLFSIQIPDDSSCHMQCMLVINRLVIGDTRDPKAECEMSRQPSVKWHNVTSSAIFPVANDNSSCVYQPSVCVF